MKVACVVIAVSVLIAGCGGEKTETTEKEVPQDVQLSAEESLLIEASSELVRQFGGSLKKELMAAIDKGGPVSAISVCRDAAPAMADSHSVGGWTIRRVSALNRNPDNRATLEEKEILTQFAAATAPGFIGRWHETDSVKTYRYYKPISVQPLCLKCHGNLQTMAPGVYQAVKKHYPDDRATGYQAGDLRGMFVVEVVWPDGEALAKTLVGDTVAPAAP